MMPNVDGIGLIRWIRAKKEHIHTPIIAMTAYGEQHLKEAKDVGATATAKKPEDIPNLPAIVTRLLGKTKRIRNGNGQNAAPA
jgi:CheY-like chemotaxis protein